MKQLDDRLDALKTLQEQANRIFKPVFYRLKNDRVEFEKLLDTPGLIVADQILEQLKELIRFKNPDKKFSTNEFESETKKHLEGLPAAEFGVWIYYPWSNRLVHSLDEEDFINIRTSRNQYKITRQERDVLMQKKIGVIGLSVGQSVSVTLAMERICGELRLADFDTLELNNLNRIRAGIHNLGLPKIYSVAREIAEIDPFLKVVCFPQGLSEENMDSFFTAGGKLDLLIEESDGFDIKILSRYKARALKVPVLMEASDRCMVDVERFDLEPERSILHGIVDHLDVATLKSLQTNEEKIPYMLDVLGIETSSVRLKASMVEMNQTINTWPQLASAVTMGGGITADVARRLLLNQYTESGRYHVDIEELIGNKKETKQSPSSPSPAISAAEMQRIIALVKNNPAADAEAAQLETIVAAAGQAPSHANGQPWQWASAGGHLYLFNPAGASFSDPAGEGAYSSLGAAIENAVLKAAELELETAMELFPVDAEKKLVARLNFNRKKGLEKNVLSACIAARQTNRRPGSGKPLDALVLQGLERAVESPGTALTFITQRGKIEELAVLAGMAERLRLLHPQGNSQCFANELKWPVAGSHITSGVDIKTLQLSTLAETAYQVAADSRVAHLLYSWNMGIAFQKMTAHTVAASSAIGLVSVPENSPETALVEAGRVVQRIWLQATKNNLGFQPICLPLYLLKYLDNPYKSTPFSEKAISELHYIHDQLVKLFPGLNVKQGAYLFRLSDAETPNARSLRKPLNEIYFRL